MPFSHTITRSFSSGSSTVTSSKTYTGGSEANLDEVIPASASNLQVNVAVPVANLQSLYISTDVAMTIRVNSSGAPTATINTVVGEPFIWPNGGSTNPLGGTNVTAFFITSTLSGTLVMRALIDPTP
jgi:hypothetical protein